MQLRGALSAADRVGEVGVPHSGSSKPADANSHSPSWGSSGDVSRESGPESLGDTVGKLDAQSSVTTAADAGPLVGFDIGGSLAKFAFVERQGLEVSE